MSPVPILRAGAEGAAAREDSLAIEEPLQILTCGRELAMTMRTPGNDGELATGFLFTEGLVRRAGEIVSATETENRVVVELAEEARARAEKVERRFTMTSACGVCGKTSVESLSAAGCAAVPSGTFAIHAAVLRALPGRLRQAQKVFERTGGLHAAGAFDAEGNAAAVREDVGRHNAVDKLIGALLRGGVAAAGIPARGHLLLVSGRASFELVQKAAMAGFPMLAAVGAPSTLAVETAKRFNMTLAGFLREDRFNIYCGAERIDGIR